MGGVPVVFCLPIYIPGLDLQKRLRAKTFLTCATQLIGETLIPRQPYSHRCRSRPVSIIISRPCALLQLVPHNFHGHGMYVCIIGNTRCKLSTPAMSTLLLQYTVNEGCLVHGFGPHGFMGKTAVLLLLRD